LEFLKVESIMAIKNYKPTTPVLRYKTVNTKDAVTCFEGFKPLTKSLNKNGGRNNRGRITVRHRGGGNKRKYRIIDFGRTKRDVPGRVEEIEYDPNRTAFLARILYKDGERRYILATANMKRGKEVIASENCEPVEGNHMPISKIPAGKIIHNIELTKNGGGKIVRSAGSYATIVAKEGNMVQLRLPSGELRNFHSFIYATVGQLSNVDNMNVTGGSAGRTRWKGRRPHVRGVVKNPVDHPMGGGEGKSSGGRDPVSPWGQKAKGLKTRKRKKSSNKYIVKRRKG